MSSETPNPSSDSAEPPTAVQPAAIERSGAGEIVIQWSDQQRTVYRAAELRKACPCATCREKRKGSQSDSERRPGLLPVLSAAEARPLEITAMHPVGQYAYNIHFSDGHNSGLFTFDLLRSLGRAP